MNHDAVLALVSAIWVTLELAARIITWRSARAPSRHDRGSYSLLWIALMVAIFTGSFVRQFPIAQMGQQDAMFWLGISLMVLGVAIRGTAILTLRRFFTVRVTIQESHELIDRGIYRLIRHPSYSGALLSFIGLGFVFRSWLSLAIIVAGALSGLAYRIHVEEEALTAHFGDRYRAYARRTKRLIPGIY
jgi:protein-S-isoprenylcysteine O-methyltransferase Ste14